MHLHIPPNPGPDRERALEEIILQLHTDVRRLWQRVGQAPQQFGELPPKKGLPQFEGPWPTSSASTSGGTSGGSGSSTS